MNLSKNSPVLGNSTTTRFSHLKQKSFAQLVSESGRGVQQQQPVINAKYDLEIEEEITTERVIVSFYY